MKNGIDIVRLFFDDDIFKAIVGVLVLAAVIFVWWFYRGFRKRALVAKEIASRFALKRGAIKDFREVEDTFDDIPLYSSQPKRSREVAQKLVATDVFVEKAKNYLTARATFSFAMALTALAICAAIVYGSFLFLSDSKTLIPIDKKLELSTSQTIVLVLRLLARTSIILAGIYISASLAKSFLHEWSMLMARRHSLRFGRLAVYLNDADLDISEMVEVFGWNLTPPSSFSSIKPENVTKGIIGQMAGAFEKGVEVTANSSRRKN